jgi:hypothetical protein
MKITIGRADKADFPELSLLDIDLKIDSGAYTSSVHCTNIEEVTLGYTSYIKFTLLDPEHSYTIIKNLLLKTMHQKL